MHLLIIGASGSGTSTLGRALAAERGSRFVDADDIYWLPTEPPFREKRDQGERRLLLSQALSSGPTVVSGSIVDWGAEVENAFGAIVFLTAPPEVRIPRLRERELAQLRHVDEAFVAWAAQYDTGTMPGRSLARHLDWLRQRHCPVLRLVSTVPLEELLDTVRAQIPNPSIERAVEGVLTALPSAAPGEHQALSVHLRSAQRGDAANLAALAIQVWLHTYATDGISSAISAYVLSEFTADAFEARLSDPSCAVVLAEIAGNVVGYALVSYGAVCPELPHARAELVTLYVQEHFVGRGIGSSLLNEAERRTRQLARSPIWLTVNAKNRRAIAFYAKHGYASMGITHFRLGSEDHENLVLVGQPVEPPGVL